MLIYVRTRREEGKRARVIPLWCPTVLLVNHLTVAVAWLALQGKARRAGMKLTLVRCYRLLHAVWRHKLRHPRMPLVSVDTTDGTRVRVRI